MASHTIAAQANISSVVSGGSAGDTYNFAPGIFYGQSWTNGRVGDFYIGDPSGNTTLSGAWKVTSWTNASGNLWYATQGISDLNGATQTNFPTPSTMANVMTASFNTTGGTATNGNTYTGQIVITVASTTVQTYSSVWNAAGTITAGAQIVGQVSGTAGSTGTYGVNVSITVGSGTVYGTNDIGQYTSASPFANFDEDLFINGVIQTRIATPGPATAGNWWHNPSNNSINVYSVGNPALLLTLTAALSTSTNSMTGGTLTVSVTSGVITAGMYIWNTAATIPNGLYIVGQLTGTAGSTGTYAYNGSATIGSATVYAGNLIEYSVQSYITANFSNQNETWQSINAEKYSNKAQTGVIHGVIGWTINNSIFRWNHSVGIVVGGATTINNCKALYNGQAGIEGGNCSLAKVLNNEIAYNNNRGYNSEWDAGGLKFAYMIGSTISGNYVHDNQGVGIWCDLESVGNVISNNLVINSIGYNGDPGGGNGIMYEVSHGQTIISNNVVSGCNGIGIFISNSNNVEVRGNTVTVGATNSSYFGGIVAVNEARGYSAYAPYPLLECRNLNVHQNTIIHTTDTAPDGINCGQSIVSPNWTFNNNVYLVPNQTTAFWRFDTAGGSTQTYIWTALQTAGVYETTGQQMVGSLQTMTAIMNLLRDGQANYSITPGDVRAIVIALQATVNYSAPYME